MSKTYCGKEFFNGDQTDICEIAQCLECYRIDATPKEPTLFEVINAKNMPFIRYNNTLLNVNNMFSFDLSQKRIIAHEAGEEGCTHTMEFNDEAEAQLAFEKIMGGNKAIPTSKELKDNKTRHHAIQSENAEFI